MIQDCQLGAGGKDKKGVEVDPRRLSSHTAIIEQLILRADQVRMSFVQCCAPGGENSSGCKIGKYPRIRIWAK